MGNLQLMIIVAFISKHCQHDQAHRPPAAGGETVAAGVATTYYTHWHSAFHSNYHLVVAI